MFPIRDSIPSRRSPVMTYIIIGVTTVVFLYELTLTQGRLNQFFYLYGLVPARYTDLQWARQAGFPNFSLWPFVTFLFLHAGWLHIILNMWALWIFGDNVEDRMGPVRFLAFYLVSGVVSGLVHALLFPGSISPTIGASGAVAGVMGAYWLWYPRSWILTMVPIFIFPFFFELPAVLFILVWFGMQLLSGVSVLNMPDGAGGVAFWAHIGGFVFGMLTHNVFRRPSGRLHAS